MKIISRYLFPVVFLLEILALQLPNETLEMAAKPLIIPSLLLYYFYHQPQVNKVFVTAMIFCWLGDVFLMFESRQALFFIFGLASFMVGHVCFIVAYRQLKTTQGEGLNNPQKLRFSFPVALIGTGLFTILFPVLGDLKVPVAIYSLVITLMVLQAIYRYGFTSSNSFWFILGGALFFLLSDSLLAINKFLQPLPLAGIQIMVTYMLAQFLITRGAVEHTKK